MNMDGLMTVQEYAEAKGITIQAAYKSLRSDKSRLYPFAVTVNGKKYIRKEALEQVEINVKQPPKVEPVSDLAFMQEQIRVLQEQLSVKDEQIKALQEQNTALTNALTQSQALHAGTLQKQLEDGKQRKGFARWFRKD